MKLSFLGACRQVTGSMYLLELEGDYKILIDCGLDTGNKMKDVVPDQYGNIFPFDPSDIDLVILTHAHMDHTGLLPNLVRYGYDGQILSTAPTYSLTRLLLLDSAALNERRMEAAKKANKLEFSEKGREKNYYHEHYYLERHVEDTTDRFVTIAFNQPFRILEGVYVTFVTAGHLLGAAHVFISAKENGETKRILFSGDIGRKGYPMLEDPIAPPVADYVICETTYANRNLTEVADYEGKLLEMVIETCVKKSGRLIIPSFAIGKSQMLLYLLNNLYMERKLPAVRVFLDSPLATGAARVTKKQIKYMNKEARERFEDYDEIFDFDNLSYVIESKQSKKIFDLTEPYIVIASAGMADGGRVVGHIKHNISNPNSTIFFINYCAEGTLGAKLLAQPENIQIDSKDYTVRAKIAQSEIYSAHAWHDDIVEFLSVQKPTEVKKIFLTHGESENMELFRSSLNRLGYENVDIPEKGQVFDL